RLRDKPVVGRVVHRGVKHPVEHQHAGALVDLVFELGPAGDLDHHGEKLVDRVREPNVVQGVHRGAEGIALRHDAHLHRYAPVAGALPVALGRALCKSAATLPAAARGSAITRSSAPTTRPVVAYAAKAATSDARADARPATSNPSTVLVWPTV